MNRLDSYQFGKQTGVVTTNVMLSIGNDMAYLHS